MKSNPNTTQGKISNMVAELVSRGFGRPVKRYYGSDGMYVGLITCLPEEAEDVELGSSSWVYGPESLNKNPGWNPDNWKTPRDQALWEKLQSRIDL